MNSTEIARKVWISQLDEHGNQSSVSFFDESAHQFALSLDDAIRNDMYVRGGMFIRAAKRFLNKQDYVLDYGCGPGRLAYLLIQNGYRILGVDQSSGMIAEAVSQDIDSRSARFEVLSLNHGWEQLTFDAVVCSSVIEYVPDAAGLLAKFHGCLRDRGKLLISFANRRSLFRLLTSRKKNENSHFTDHQYHLWTGREARRVLESSGFRIVGRPVYFEASAFDKRPPISFLSRFSLIGSLGLLVAEKSS
ncbi:MAG: class I SAM-dependent methyltransferase [Pirellula sp.]